MTYLKPKMYHGINSYTMVHLYSFFKNTMLLAVFITVVACPKLTNFLRYCSIIKSRKPQLPWYFSPKQYSITIFTKLIIRGNVLCIVLRNCTQYPDTSGNKNALLLSFCPKMDFLGCSQLQHDAIIAMQSGSSRWIIKKEEQRRF